MPNVRVNGVDIHYEERGAGTEAVVFAHGLLFDKSIFADQIAALEGRYRCIAFDFRGQGESEITRSGYDIDTLSDDAAALIEALGAAPCHFVGLSMGGFVALRLAIRRPALLRSLILLDTSADPERLLDRLRYHLLAFVARWFGFRPVISRVMPIMFSENALRDPALMNRWRDRILANDRIGATRAVGGVIDRAGVYDELETIALPTLVIVGDRDRATVPAHSRRLHAAIRDSQLIVLPGVGHMSTLEAPAAVAETLRRFLGER
jgi:pimeloyl-ACP methyl ester carboxylesterase